MLFSPHTSDKFTVNNRTVAFLITLLHAGARLPPADKYGREFIHVLSRLVCTIVDMLISILCNQCGWCVDMSCVTFSC